MVVLPGCKFRIVERINPQNVHQHQSALRIHGYKKFETGEQEYLRFQFVRINPHLDRPWLSTENAGGIVLGRIVPCQRSVVSGKAYRMILISFCPFVHLLGFHFHACYRHAGRAEGDASTNGG